MSNTVHVTRSFPIAHFHYFLIRFHTHADYDKKLAWLVAYTEVRKPSIDLSTISFNHFLPFLDRTCGAGWLSLEDDNMFWGDEQPQSVASVLDASPAATVRLFDQNVLCQHNRICGRSSEIAGMQTSHSPGEKGQQLDSSFMSCGSSADTMGRLMMLSGDEGTMSPPLVSQPLQPSKAATESLAREVLVINGLPLEARATAMGMWMKKVQRYGGDFYNQCVQRAVGMLSTMVRSSPGNSLQ